MRLATSASIGLIAISAAALAQVAGGPEEQKVPAAGATAAGNDASASSIGDTAANITTPPANDMAPATPADEPKTGASPRRR